MSGRVIRTLALLVTLEFMSILLHIFVVGIDVGTLNKLRPFAIQEVQLLLAMKDQNQFSISLYRSYENLLLIDNEAFNVMKVLGSPSSRLKCQHSL